MTLEGYDPDDNKITQFCEDNPVASIGIPVSQYIEPTIAFIPDYIYGVGEYQEQDIEWGFMTEVGEFLYLSSYPDLFDDLSEILSVGDAVSFYSSNVTEIEADETYYIVAVSEGYLKISETLGGAAISFGTEEQDCAMSYHITAGTPIRNNLGVAAVQMGDQTEVYSRYFPLDQPGYMIKHCGWVVDFAPDLSQPSSVATWRVNRDIFNFNDNDDKRKVATKVTVRGKDIQGASISVSLSGIRAMDSDRQFYTGCTYITRKSEGYIYKNNFAGAEKTIDAITTGGTHPFTTDYASYTDRIEIATYCANYPVGSQIIFLESGGDRVVPSGITPSLEPGTMFYYYVVYNSGGATGYIKISTTQGGSAMDIGSDSGGSFDSWVKSFGNFQIDNSDSYLDRGTAFIIGGTTMPTNMVSNRVYYCSTDGTTSGTFKFCCSINASGEPVFGIFGSPASLHINTLPLSGMSELGYSPVIWLYGWDYAIPSGSNIYCSVPGGAVTAFVTSGVPVEAIDNNGVMYTAVTLTTWPQTDYSGRGYLMNRILYVDKISDCITADDTLRVGEEDIAIDFSECSVDTNYGEYLVCTSPTSRTTSSTNKCYPHGVGAMVMNPDVYDIQSPEANSPVYQHGQRIADVTVDSNITYGYLDAYATALLLGQGTLYKKATCVAPITKATVKHVGIGLADIADPDSEYNQEINRVRLPRVGDRITIQTDAYENYTEDWVIMSITIKYDQGVLEIIFGDFEMNPISSMIKQTSGLNRPVT